MVDVPGMGRFVEPLTEVLHVFTMRLDQFRCQNPAIREGASEARAPEKILESVARRRVFFRCKA